jgi:hypothetical protein
MVTRHICENNLEQAEDIRHSPLSKKSYAQRKETLERAFADLKEKYRMTYIHYSGIVGISKWERLNHCR